MQPYWDLEQSCRLFEGRITCQVHLCLRLEVWNTKQTSLRSALLKKKVFRYCMRQERLVYDSYDVLCDLGDKDLVALHLAVWTTLLSCAGRQ